MCVCVCKCKYVYYVNVCVKMKMYMYMYIFLSGEANGGRSRLGPAGIQTRTTTTAQCGTAKRCTGHPLQHHSIAGASVLRRMGGVTLVSTNEMKPKQARFVFHHTISFILQNPFFFHLFHSPNVKSIYVYLYIY